MYRPVVNTPGTVQRPVQKKSLHWPPAYRPFVPAPAAQPKTNRPGRPAARIVIPRSVIQRAAMDLEEVSSPSSSSTLASIAKTIHVGSLSQSTTGIARLKSGKLVAATQSPVDQVKKKASENGVVLEDVISTYGAGYHCETSLYIKFGKDGISAMGASQGFCPHCQEFLTSKGITMDGDRRSTRDQVWRSPEFMANTEVASGASYPWVYFKDEVEGKRVEFKTKAAYAEWHLQRTGEKFK